MVEFHTPLRNQGHKDVIQLRLDSESVESRIVDCTSHTPLQSQNTLSEIRSSFNADPTRFFEESFDHSELLNWIKTNASNNQELSAHCTLFDVENSHPKTTNQSFKWRKISINRIPKSASEDKLHLECDPVTDSQSLARSDSWMTISDSSCEIVEWRKYSHNPSVKSTSNDLANLRSIHSHTCNMCHCQTLKSIIMKSRSALQVDGKESRVLTFVFCIPLRKITGEYNNLWDEAKLVLNGKKICLIRGFQDSLNGDLFFYGNIVITDNSDEFMLELTDGCGDHDGPYFIEKTHQFDLVYNLRDGVLQNGLSVFHIGITIVNRLSCDKKMIMAFWDEVTGSWLHKDFVRMDCIQEVSVAARRLIFNVFTTQE